MKCFCGAPLVQKYQGRPPVYCSTKCRTDLRWAYEHNEFIDRRRQRLCPQCGEPVPESRRAAKFCCRECSQRAWYESARESATWVETRKMHVRHWQRQQRA